MCSQLTSFSTFLKKKPTLGRERDIQKGVCITTACGMQRLAIQEHLGSKDKNNLYWKSVLVYRVIVTSVPLLPYIRKETELRCQGIMQEYEPQPTAQPSEMLLAEPGVKDYTSCPSKANPGLFEH